MNLEQEFDWTAQAVVDALEENDLDRAAGL